MVRKVFSFGCVIAFVMIMRVMVFAQAFYTPSGWTYFMWPYAYDTSSQSWRYFNESDTQWCVDMSTEHWSLLGTSQLASGWVYWGWPYAYGWDSGLWFYFNESDVQWVLDLSSDTWNRLGEAGGESFSYDISFDVGDSDPLTAQISLDDQPLAITVTALTLNGTYHTGTQETTSHASSMISVDTTEILFGELEITITQQVRLLGDNIPTEGAFEVRSGTDMIQVAVNPDVGGAPGVDITFENNTTSLTWDDFEDIEDDPGATEEQQIARFGLTSFEFVLERALHAFEAFQTIKKNETALDAAGSAHIGLTETCDQFPPQGGSSGTREYVWVDASSSGELGSGDRFLITYNSDSNGCWCDDPSDSIDILIRGTLQLNDYVKNVDEADDLISMGAEVLFDDFVVQETEQVTEESFIVDDYEVITDGGFGLVVTPSP
jgi:hypothetical protein